MWFPGIHIGSKFTSVSDIVERMVSLNPNTAMMRKASPGSKGKISLDPITSATGVSAPPGYE
jgi:hypothetical protein